MKIEYFGKLLDEYDNQYHAFDLIENKFSNRPDLHAFILLDKLLPNENYIVAAAEHDQIWLGVELEDLLEVITDENVLDLVRCGVFYDEEVESLSMFA